MPESRTPLESLNAAIAALGSQSAMARLLEVSQPSVSDWVNRMERLPAEHVLAVEAATRVSRHELRLDLYPREGCCAEQCPEHGTPSREDTPSAPPADSRVGMAGGSDSRAASAAAQPPAGSGPLPAGGSHTPDALAGVRP